MADGRVNAKSWKRYNSPINGPIWMKLGWSHPIMSSTCPAWCSCHGNGRCLATAHCTFSSYGRLEAKRVNQFWWNFVHISKFGPQWQSRDQILKLLKFKMADSRHVRKYSKCHNSPTNGPWDVTTQVAYQSVRLVRNLGGHIPSCSRHVPMMRLPWQGHWLATAHWTFCSYGRREAERVNQFRWILVHSSMFGPQWQSRDQILKLLKFKMADGRHVRKYWKNS